MVMSVMSVLLLQVKRVKLVYYCFTNKGYYARADPLAHKQVNPEEQLDS